MNSQVLRAEAERALEAERRAREAPRTARNAAERAGGGDTARVFRNNGEIQGFNGRVIGGRPLHG